MSGNSPTVLSMLWFFVMICLFVPNIFLQEYKELGGTLFCSSSINASSEQENVVSDASEECELTNKPQSLKQIEMQAIIDSLERNDGNKSRTADELGVSLKTLYNKLNQMESTETNPEAA